MIKALVALSVVGLLAFLVTSTPVQCPYPAHPFGAWGPRVTVCGYAGPLGAVRVRWVGEERTDMAGAPALDPSGNPVPVVGGVGR